MIGRLAAVVALAVAAGSCAGESRTFEVAINADLGGNAPFSISAPGGTIVLERGSTTAHTLVFTATEAVILDDIRWTFAATRDDRVFATAGHGCGPSIDHDSGSIRFACTEDYRYLAVGPGKPLNETITLYGGLEGRPVATGRFAFRQPIRWWHATGDPLDPRGEMGGEVTVTLTYNVDAR